METNKKDLNGQKDQKDQRTGNNYSNSTINMNNNRNESPGGKGSPIDRGKTDEKLEKKPQNSSVHTEQRDQRTGTPTAMNNSLSEKEPVERGKAGDMKNQKDLFSQNDQKDQRNGSSTPSGKSNMGNSRNESLDKGTADRGSKPGVDKSVSSRDKADTIGRK